ncbi:MAG: DUF3783 domain-containing protein [bacterium]|nr:DUF3783 domain-containing protein [bacterium]
MRRNETVLLYAIKDKEKRKKIQTLLLLMGVRIRMVEPKQYALPLAQLLEGKTEPEALLEATEEELCEFEEEMLVLSGFSGSRLDELLLALRRQKARVDLKAVVTESNRAWNSKELYQELRKEHRTLHGEAGEPLGKDKGE